MKALLTSKKAIVCFWSVSAIVLAGTIKDFHSRSTIIENAETIEKEIIPAERSVASEAAARVAQMYLPPTAVNFKKINTMWEITRIIDNDERVAYDKFANQEDAQRSIKVPMELIDNGIIRVNKDNEQIYRVSLLSEFGTIALFKKLGKGYEILEARKVVKAKRNTSLMVSSEDIELVLERALNQAKSPTVLVRPNVSGQVTLNAKTISALSVELRNPNGEIQNIEIDTADLMDGGTFKADVAGEEVSGVVLNNGKDGYRISFVTGPIAGSMLNFVTEDQMEKVEETQRDTESNQDPAPELAAQEIVEERKDVASDPDKYEEVRVLSPDEIQQTAQEKGFSF